MSLSPFIQMSLATLAAVFVVGCIGPSDEDPGSASDTDEAVDAAYPDSTSGTDEAVGAAQQAYSVGCDGDFCVVTCGRGGRCVHWGGNVWACGCEMIP